MGTFSDNSTRDLTTQVTWGSLDGNNSTIRNDPGSQGLAYGAGVGTSIITATSGIVSGSTTLTVTPAVLESISSISPAYPAIPKGTTQQLTASGMFSDNSLQDVTASVTWSSSDTGVATISNTAGTIGMATSVENGAATITATSGSISRSTTLSVLWISRVSGSTNRLNSVAWSGTQFVAVGDYGTILTSPDGVTWTTRPLDTNTHATLLDVVWTGTKFVVVGECTYSPLAIKSDTILTSPDGVTWTWQTAASQKDLYGIAWSGTKFVAVGESGTILTSPDGVTWTSQTLSTAIAMYAGAWSGTQFVVVGRGGSGYGPIFTSPDGVVWTSVMPISGIDTFPLTGVVWSGSQFVVVGFGGKVRTSPDGVTWTPRYAPWADTLQDVAWSGSQFVAVGSTYRINTTASTIITSSDGATWTWQQVSTGTETLNGVAWSGTRFVAVGQNGTILTPP